MSHISISPVRHQSVASVPPAAPEGAREVGHGPGRHLQRGHAWGRQRTAVPDAAPAPAPAPAPTVVSAPAPTIVSVPQPTVVSAPQPTVDSAADPATTTAAPPVAVDASTGAVPVADGTTVIGGLIDTFA